MEYFFSFLQLSLNSLVLHVELVDDRRTLLVGIVGYTLSFYHIIHLLTKSSQHTDSTLAVEVHSVEHLTKILHVTTLQALGHCQDCTIDILRHKFLILLHLHASETSKRIEVGSHLHQQLTESSGSHLIT